MFMEQMETVGAAWVRRWFEPSELTKAKPSSSYAFAVNADFHPVTTVRGAGEAARAPV